MKKSISFFVLTALFLLQTACGAVSTSPGAGETGTVQETGSSATVSAPISEAPTASAQVSASADRLETPAQEPTMTPEPDLPDAATATPDQPPVSTPSPTPEPMPAPTPTPAQDTQPSGTYVGSVQSDKYHDPSCRFAKKILPENEIWFDTAEEAKANGYLACGVCKP